MKLIEVVADAGSMDTVASIAEQNGARDFRLAHKDEDGRQAMRILVTDDKVQPVLDALQSILGSQSGSRAIVIAIEAALPHLRDEGREREDAATASREALYASAEKNSHFSLNFVVLVVLSTIVAAIGLIEDNVAVVIGAMVIAPLLGPNLALALGTALGDLALMRESLITTIGGIAIALVLSILIGVLWPFELVSHELMSRTVVGIDSVALALASGAAAALSLTTGLSSVLVGVMVAVALLPPTATLGLMLGHGEMQHAMHAGLLLAINVVSVNLAAKVVFLFKGIRPRTWYEKEKAKRAMFRYLMIWTVSLVILLAAIYSLRVVT